MGFGVYKRTKDEKQHAAKMINVVPTQRVDSHLVPEDGSVAVKEAGICMYLSVTCCTLFKGEGSVLALKSQIY